MSYLTSGQLAKKAQVNIQTIFYYERRGLIPAPPRGASSGYRLYPPKMVMRIRFIRRAKELGFSLREIKEILSLGQIPSLSTAEVIKKTEEKIADINSKIKNLKAIKKSLLKVAEGLRNGELSDKCPVLSAFGVDY